MYKYQMPFYLDCTIVNMSEMVEKFINVHFNTSYLTYSTYPFVDLLYIPSFMRESRNSNLNTWGGIGRPAKKRDKGRSISALAIFIKFLHETNPHQMIAAKLQSHKKLTTNHKPTHIHCLLHEFHEKGHQLLFQFSRPLAAHFSICMKRG